MTRLKKTVLAAVIVATALFVPVLAMAGSLDPSAAPAPTMKTLDQVPPTWSQKLQCDTTACQRFELVMDGESVLDKETGLVWQQGPSSVVDSWSDAIFQCQRESTQTGKRIGWRLPTIEELASLNDFSGSGLPAGHPFSGVYRTKFWSASTYANDSSYALLYDTYGGPATVSFQPKTNMNHVWCVRGGQGYIGQ